jgi:osmoprotectant transport system ATP-binding protein
MISIRGLTKEFGGMRAVDDLSLDVRTGETLVLLGRSGCGKTTTLRMINRLVTPTSGIIRVRSRDTAGMDPVELRRGIGYMIQSVGLFPHRTVEENILTVPSLLGWARARCRERMKEVSRIVDLDPSWWKRYPDQLSGGQRQRVGLARALAADPPIVLMDEPFGALDPITRQQVRAEFRKIDALVRKTIVLVTHDIAEAVELGDRICLMDRGRIAQLGSAAELLFRPVSPFVREFFDHGRLQTEWMALRVGDLVGNPAPGSGLAAEMTVADALARLERTDEAAFGQLVAAFFDFKRGAAH